MVKIVEKFKYLHSQTNFIHIKKKIIRLSKIKKETNRC